MAGQKLEADRRLIKALTDTEPLDWMRRDNGDLVYLSAQGQKFILADAEIQKLRSATQVRGAEMSELRRSPSAISSDSTDAALARKRRPEPVEGKSEAAPAKKPGLRSDTPERGAEMHEKKHGLSAIFSGSAPEKKIIEHLPSVSHEGVETKTDLGPSAVEEIKGAD